MIIGAGAAGVVLLGGLGLGAVWLFTGGPFGGGVETSEGELQNAEDWIQRVSAEWREGLPGENVTLSEAPECFFILDGNGISTREIACGGARQAGADEGHVWDLGTFTVSQDPQEGLVAAEWEFTEQSMTRPDGQVVTASGAEAPGEIDGLEAPPLPNADSGLVSTDVPGDLELTESTTLGEEGLIITPAGELQIESAGRLEVLEIPGAGGEGQDGDEGDDAGGEEDLLDEGSGSFSDLTVDSGEYAPAEGETFMVLELSWQAGESGQDASVIHDDGTSREEIIDLMSAEGWAAPEESHTVLVSAPEDGSHALRIASDGHEQTVDPATGERQPDALADTFYRDPDEQSLNQPFEFDNQTAEDSDGDDVEFEASAYINQAGITPYVDDEDGEYGWAEEGEMWLLLDMELFFDIDDSGRWNWDVLDGSEVRVVATDASGDSYEETLTISGFTTWGYEESLLAIGVPAEGEDFTLEVEFDVDLRPGEPPSQSLEFRGDSVEVSFPDESPDEEDEDAEGDDDGDPEDDASEEDEED